MVKVTFAKLDCGSKWGVGMQYRSRGKVRRKAWVIGRNPFFRLRNG